MYSINKYYIQNVLVLKNSISCFNLFKSRSIETCILKFKDFFFLDFGFNYNYLKIKNFADRTNYLFIKDFEFVRSLRYMSFNNIKYDFIYSNRWLFLNKVSQFKCLIVGRFLNSYTNRYHSFYCIGVCGCVSLISKKKLLFLGNNLISVFRIGRVRFLRKEIFLSQRFVTRSVYRVLFKLSSQINYSNQN